VPRRNIFSAAVRINKQELLRQAGLEEPAATDEARSESDSSGRAQIGPAGVKCGNNLKQLALAMHNYHDAYNAFPAVANFSKDGKPLLSWRVHLLPYLEQDALYREFHLDEPWDSAHNKELIARMPAVFRCPKRKAADKDKTTYVVPVGSTTIFPGSAKGLSFRDITDGLSNTIILLDVDDGHAVTWTRPEDLKYDPNRPLTGLAGHHPGVIPVMFADGSLHFLRAKIAKQKLQALFTRNGNEVVQLDSADDATPGSPREFFGLPGIGIEGMEALGYREFLNRGIGNQIGLHVYDAPTLVDFNLPAFLGMMMGGVNGPGLDEEVLGISFLAASLNAPTYLAIPVRDVKVVDRFLEKLDSFLPMLDKRATGGILPLDVEFYECRTGGRERSFRTCGLRIGPIKWRLFWARVGDGLYIASKPFILEDLLSGKTMPRASEQTSSGPRAHGMVRLRPENWKEVLPDYRLGWAENNREACVNNLGPLSSVARSLTASLGKLEKSELATLAGRMRGRADDLYGTHFFCPEGGTYVLTADGKRMECSLHGSIGKPRQNVAPAESSALTKLLETLGDVTASLTFLEDGLHAVVEIERK
jgi:hypothetical protein